LAKKDSELNAIKATFAEYKTGLKDSRQLFMGENITKYTSFSNRNQILDRILKDKNETLRYNF
jgi:hypothetical protein